ncbi:MAG TPA: hypothetical protein VJ979_14945 [Actinomycetota bacterium]|nr:hypothetical protein [Actinomycetota bacterium]
MSHSRRRAGILAVVLAAAMALGAVAVSSGAGAASGPREVHIDIRYSRFSEQRIEVAPGEAVRFVLVNRDPIAHEFIVGDARMQLVHERGSEARHAPRPGEISIPAGTTRATTVMFGADSVAGFTLFGCHLPGHYAYGMTGAIEFVR